MTTETTIRTKELKDKIRNDLQNAFPKAKFKVVGQTGRGTARSWSEMSVTWHDGPTYDEVAAITKDYPGNVLVDLIHTVSCERCGGLAIPGYEADDKGHIVRAKRALCVGCQRIDRAA
jgi:hypothetical protein